MMTTKTHQWPTVTYACGHRQEIRDVGQFVQKVMNGNNPDQIHPLDAGALIDQSLLHVQTLAICPDCRELDRR